MRAMTGLRSATSPHSRVDGQTQTLRRFEPLEHALTPHGLDGYLASSDPNFEAKAADIIGLSLHPPQHAAVFCVDEKTAIQALAVRDVPHEDRWSAQEERDTPRPSSWRFSRRSARTCHATRKST